MDKKNITFKSWPDIPLFHNIVKYTQSKNIDNKITYYQKIKLDGTNAAIQILSTGEVIAQSRTQVITPDKDNAGFANWVFSQESFLSSLKKANINYTIFGEWCGQGIQKRCSISKIDKKIFAIFSILVEDNINPPYYIVNKDQIINIIPETDDIKIIDFLPTKIVMDFSSKENLNNNVNILNDIVNSIEDCDPWVKEQFGIEGLGEGIVLYPIVDNGFLFKEFFDNFIFKAKGEKHNVVKMKQSVQIEPEKASSIEEFVKLFVTEARLEQFANDKYDQKLIGNFLKNFSNDVEKESQAELEASKLSWKDVSKDILTTARNWYIEKIKKI